MAAPEGQKRWIAVLSLDVVGFSAITREIGGEKSLEMISEVLGLAREATQTQGGHVVDTAGDGLLAVFGAPQALENAAAQACRAAVDIRAGLAKRASQLAERFGRTPEVRMGLDGGVVVVAQTDGAALKVVGDPVNRAARLQEAASTGMILISDAIRGEAAATLDLGPRRSLELKGFGEAISVHDLEGVRTLSSRFEGTRGRTIPKLVSRERELEHALQTLSGDDPGILLIRGLAGIGKSRLVHEISTKLGRSHQVVLGQCLASRDAEGFAPFFDMLAEIADAEVGVRGESLLRQALERFPGDGDHLTLARAFDPKAEALDRALALRETVERLILRIAADRPIIFIVEDAHWIDPASEDLLRRLSERSVPVLVTSRPAYQPGWATTTSATVIELSSLSRGDLAALGGAFAGEVLSDELAQLLWEKSEGVPLIAEEIIRALRASDRLVATEGEITLSGEDAYIVTGNLEQMVLSRVDRLAERERGVIQVAAAIGRDFSWPLLAQSIGEPDASPDDFEFDALIERSGQEVWRFTHALIQEAVLAGLLSARRRAVHLQVAQALEDETQNENRNWARLAGHYLEAEAASDAIRCLSKAAEQSLDVYALRQVDQFIEQAMELIDAEPALVSDTDYCKLVAIWFRALNQAALFGKIEEMSRRVMSRVDAAPYATETAIINTHLGLALTHLRDYPKSRDIVMASLARAEAADDAHGAAWAKGGLLRLYEETHWADRQTIERLHAEIMPVAEAFEDRYLAMMAHYQLSSTYRSRGYRTRALDVGKEIEAYARTHNDRRARAYAQWTRALVHCVDGEPEAALSYAQACKDDIVPGTADAYVVDCVEHFAQIAFVPSETLVPDIEKALARARALPDMNIAHSYLFQLALVAFRDRRLAEGWRRLHEMYVEFTGAGNVALIRQFHFARSEVVLAILGLTDPDSEAPPERIRFPAARPGPGDIATYVWIKLTGRRLADRDFRYLLESYPEKRGSHYARACIGLGLLAVARGRIEEGRTRLLEGLEAAREEEVELLVRRAEKALAAL